MLALNFAFRNSNVTRPFSHLLLIRPKKESKPAWRYQHVSIKERTYYVGIKSQAEKRKEEEILVANILRYMRASIKLISSFHTKR